MLPRRDHCGSDIGCRLRGSGHSAVIATQLIKLACRRFGAELCRHRAHTVPLWGPQIQVRTAAKMKSEECIQYLVCMVVGMVVGVLLCTHYRDHRQINQHCAHIALIWHVLNQNAKNKSSCSAGAAYTPNQQLRRGTRVDPFRTATSLAPSPSGKFL